MKNNYNFFQNSECRYFPCHLNMNKKEFSCLFCYCPLYNFKKCNGNYIILKNGIKDCSNCILPHFKSSYRYIIKQLIKRS